MRPRLGDWLWGLLFLLSIAGTWRSAGSGALGQFIGVGVSLATVLPALLALWWLDRLPPLPWRTWWRTLGFGLLTVPLVASYAHLYIEITVGDSIADSERFDAATAGGFGDLAGSLLSAPILEETFKGLIPLCLLFASVNASGLRRHEVGPWPALVIGLLVTLAFGSAENGTHFARNAADWNQRLLFPYLHGLFSLPMLLGIGFAALLPSLSSRVGLVAVGWMASVAFHAMWNAQIRFEPLGWSLWPWIRHAAILSPAVCALAVGLVYAWEVRTLRRHGASPPDLRRRPRSGGGEDLAASREAILSRPLAG